ncbi:hypothetical protein [Vulcanisaeta sp. JCM 16159]|uniref:hypothetical protein n=1 Tax=Vulcanisaeta sp. JCM 16159 TaxID=1295371 RepID=UPI000A67B49C|nr:hypothetical protein [Vulcanisaeta sp. JCM 16159]
MVYALLMLGISLGFSGFLTWYIMGTIITSGTSQALTMASQYSGLALAGIPLQAYYAIIGSGFASGYASSTTGLLR